MRTTLEDRIRRERVRVILTAVIGFFGVIIVCNILFAAAVTVFEMPARARSLFGAVSIGAAAFSSSFLTARRRRHSGIAVALIVAGAVVIMVGIGALISPAASTLVGTLSKTALVVVAALTGGIYGVNAKQKI